MEGVIAIHPWRNPDRGYLVPLRCGCTEPGLSQRTLWHEGAGVTADTFVRETGVIGVTATGRGVSVDAAAFVLIPVAVLADTAGLLLVTRAPEGTLTTERDADGTAAVEVDGRLTRKAVRPQPAFPPVLPPCPGPVD